MAYWLVKTEPHTWSWDDQVREGTTPWEGVRNYQARNNLKAMEIGDLALFYHSGSERRIMGIVEVSSPYKPDPSDSTHQFGMVDMKTVRPLAHPVTLSEIKEDPHLQNLPLIRQSRLSVMPIEEEAWRILCAKGIPL